jgi:hypothetical protein
MFNKSNIVRPSVALPSEIATKILDLEVEYDNKTITRESITELMGLYSVLHCLFSKLLSFMKRIMIKNTLFSKTD